MLPTVPLYLQATLLFAKSSERLHHWFTGTTLYKKNLESYVQGQGMTFATKLRITVTITISMAIGCWFVSHLPAAQLVLAVIWICLMIYFFAFVKTRRTGRIKKPEAQSSQDWASVSLWIATLISFALRALG